MIGGIELVDFSISLCCARNDEGGDLRGKIKDLRNGDSSQGMINRSWGKSDSVIYSTVLY